MGLVITVEPAEEPVTLAEASLFMRYTGSLQNAVVTALITAARKDVESWTNKTMVTTTYEFYTDSLSGEGLLNEILLPTGTVQSITSISYQDPDDATQTLSSTLYKLDNKSIQNKVFRDPLETYPEVLAQPNCVKITFDAGYGAASAVPENMKTVIKMRVAELFEHREANTAAPRQPNKAMMAILSPAADYRF
jgi:uncharacterized phiE125 gp8 family phage protein